jgi:hypothetical protein
MKRLTLAAVILCLALGALAADKVAPQSVTATNLRATVSNPFTSDTLYTAGSSILFTNCVAYSGAGTNSAKQGLSGVTMKLIVSDGTTTTTNTATAISTNGGTWTATATLPDTTSSVFWQLKLTDAQTNIYYYGKQILKTQKHL